MTQNESGPPKWTNVEHKLPYYRWTAECVPLVEEAATAPVGDESEASEEDPAPDPARPWIHDVVVRRRGGLVLPVTIRVTLEDGASSDYAWTREMQMEKRWWRLPITPGPKKIASVVIDPERLWFLDRNMSNNQWFSKPDRLAPLRWGERAMTRSSNVLQWIMAAGG